MLKEKPTAISLFCGAGGCSLGFKMAGYNIVYASDKNKEAVETYKKNFPDTLVECESIEKINFQSIMKKLKLERGDLDILIGGPPCQGFTSAGSRLLDDPRNHLLNSYVTALDTLMPKWFLMDDGYGQIAMMQAKKAEWEQKAPLANISTCDGKPCVQVTGPEYTNKDGDRFYLIKKK